MRKNCLSAATDRGEHVAFTYHISLNLAPISHIPQTVLQTQAIDAPSSAVMQCLLSRYRQLSYDAVSLSSLRVCYVAGRIGT